MLPSNSLSRLQNGRRTPLPRFSLAAGSCHAAAPRGVVGCRNGRTRLPSELLSPGHKRSGSDLPSRCGMVDRWSRSHPALGCRMEWTLALLDAAASSGDFRVPVHSRPLIEWAETRIGMEAFRGGVVVPHALRKYPEHYFSATRSTNSGSWVFWCTMLDQSSTPRWARS